MKFVAFPDGRDTAAAFYCANPTSQSLFPPWWMLLLHSGLSRFINLGEAWNRCECRRLHRANYDARNGHQVQLTLARRTLSCLVTRITSGIGVRVRVQRHCRLISGCKSASLRRYRRGARSKRLQKYQEGNTRAERRMRPLPTARIDTVQFTGAGCTRLKEYYR